jgi:hypothetical protein
MGSGDVAIGRARASVVLVSHAELLYGFGFMAVAEL